MTSRRSFLVPLPSDTTTPNSTCSYSSNGLLSPCGRLSTSFVLPSPPMSQGSPSSSLCPSDTSSSSRRSSTSSHVLSPSETLSTPPTLLLQGSTLPPLFGSLSASGLDLNDRDQLHKFMTLDSTETDCDMAAEVINLLIPGSGLHAGAAFDAQAEQKLLSRYLLYWTSLTPHSLCVLISTVILLERLRFLHPGLSATGQVKDTLLRVVFSAYLAAMKLCTEVSYLNSAFVGRTPWTTREINSMEREILLHLDYDCFIPAEQIVHRAQSFWLSRELAACPPSSKSGTNTKVVVIESDEDSLTSLEVDSFDLKSQSHAPAVQVQQANMFRNVAYSSAYAL